MTAGKSETLILELIKCHRLSGFIGANPELPEQMANENQLELRCVRLLSVGWGFVKIILIYYNKL